MVTIGTPRIAGQTYAGRSVRYQPSGEITAARNLNQAELREKFTPVSNPAETVAQYIQDNSRWDSADLPRLVQAVPAKNGQAFHQIPYQTLPQGSESAYNWLKQRIESGKIKPRESEQFDSMNIDKRTVAVPPVVFDSASDEISSIAQTPAVGVMTTSVGYELPEGVEYVPGKLQEMGIPHLRTDLLVDKNQSPMERAKVLAHEAGHWLGGHSDDMGRGLQITSEGMRETEAETIAYGVMNRLYPWQKATLSNAAAYGVDTQFTAGKERIGQFGHGISQIYGNQAVDPVAHLRDPEVQNIVNHAVTQLVPNPRKPFRNIKPAVYGMHTSPTRNLGPVVQAHQQEELMAQAALADRYGRYGY